MWRPTLVKDAFPRHAGLCRGGPEDASATRGTKMEKLNDQIRRFKESREDKPSKENEQLSVEGKERGDEGKTSGRQEKPAPRRNKESEEVEVFSDPVNPFGKKPRVSRTPPLRERAKSVADPCVRISRIPWEEDSMDSWSENEKRKRRESPKEGKEVQREKVFKKTREHKRSEWNTQYRDISDKREGNKNLEDTNTREGNARKAKDFLDVIERITEEIRILREIVIQNRNTKVELKDSSSTLEDLADQLDEGEYLSFIKDVLEKNRRESTRTVPQTQKEVERLTKVDASTQTEIDPWKLRNERSAAGIRERIRKCEEVKDMLEVANLGWPKEAYKVTKELTGNPIWVNNEKDLAIFIVRESKFDDAVERQVCSRFPEIVEEGIEEGVCVLAYEVRTERGKGMEQVNRRTIAKIVVEEDDEATVRNLVKWKEKIKKLKVNRVAVPYTDVADNKLRKFIECVLWDSEVNIMMYTTLKKKQRSAVARQNLEKDYNKKREERNSGTEVVLVKGEGKSYADLLKTVKDRVDVKSLGVTVKGVRKTREGELLLEVNKKDKILGILKNELTKCFNEEEGVTVREGRRNFTTVMIKGIDATAPMEEVLTVLKETLKVEEGEIKVTETRTSFDGNKSAVVSVAKELASTLLEMREVRIGWSTCRITQRNETKRCLRCWGVGHFAKECSGEDRSKKCLKCGSEGHKVQQCENEPFCPICDRGGHRADSMSCPILRKRVEALRQGERRRTQINENREPTAMETNQEGQGVATSAQGTAQELVVDT